MNNILSAKGADVKLKRKMRKGKANFPINRQKGTPLIIKASSGWAKKAIIN